MKLFKVDRIIKKKLKKNLKTLMNNKIYQI